MTKVDRGSKSFEQTTAVTVAEDGRILGFFDSSWGASERPHGGIFAALAVRAIEAKLGHPEDLRLKSITFQFLRRPDWGEVEFDVEIVQRGRRVVFIAFKAKQGGSRGVIMSGVAAFLVPGLTMPIEFVAPMPQVGPAPTTDSPTIPIGEYTHKSDGWLESLSVFPPFWQHYLMAPRNGNLPMSNTPIDPKNPPSVGGWAMPKVATPIDNALIVQIADIFWPPTFAAVDKPFRAPTVDLTVHIRADIPLGGLPAQPIYGQFTSTSALHGIVEEDGVLYLSDGTLLAQSRQMAMLFR